MDHFYYYLFNLLSMFKCQMISFWYCIFGPKLYQIYYLKSSLSTQYSEHFARVYVKNAAETLSDSVFLILKVFAGILQFSWPLYVLYFYYKERVTYENCKLFLQTIIFIWIIPIYFMLLRGISRFINPSYNAFIKDFVNIKYNSKEHSHHEFLARYDFSLSYWKPDYEIHVNNKIHISPLPTNTHDSTIRQVKRTLNEQIFHYACLLLGYICVNTFGRRLMFPGSLEIVRHSMNRTLLDGRAKLIVFHNAKRSVLRTDDGDNIDTVFVDARYTRHSQILIITCEGNAGFYEAGSMLMPIHAGYSVLGWNRPGFGESSGYPGVLSEIHAIDVVIRYAIDVLHFKPDNIVVFGWSIGGYSACWAAVNYPNIRGIILDAVFDDILPLAQRQMPTFASKFVEKTIRFYLNLNNTELLKLYNGPFYLIRRTHDEVMNTIPNKPATNCINEILFTILPYRYPYIYDSHEILLLMQQYIRSDKKQRKHLNHMYDSNRDEYKHQITKYRQEHPIATYPCRFGENVSLNERKFFAIFLINHYLVDFKSRHCTTLPQEYFFLPRRCV